MRISKKAELLFRDDGSRREHPLNMGTGKMNMTASWPLLSLPALRRDVRAWRAFRYFGAAVFSLLGLDRRRRRQPNISKSISRSTLAQLW